MSRFFNTITFGTVGARIALRRITSLVFALAMTSQAHAECGCEDGITVSVEGNIPEFKVAGVGKGPAATIDVEMKQDPEYLFTLTKGEGELSNGCNSGTVYLECGLEYQIQTGENSSSEFTAGRTIHIAVIDNKLVPDKFRLRVKKKEGEQPNSQNPQTVTPESDTPSDQDNEVPAMSTDPKYDASGNFQSGLLISISLNTIGLGPGNSAPFISAGHLAAGGPVTANLAKPVNFSHIASEQVTGRPADPPWGEALPTRVAYAAPSGYPQERHAVTPTHLFRVTGFNVNKETPVDVATAQNTYVREYLRAGSSESAALTLAREPSSWWTITRVTNGVRVTQFKKGVLKFKEFVGPADPSDHSLIVEKDGVTTHVILVPPATTGAPYDVQTEKTVSGVLVEKRLQTFEMVGGVYKLSADTVYPASTGAGLTTEYHYYPSTAGNSAGKLWFVKEPTLAWQVFEYSGNGDTVVYTPFASEAIIDTSHSDPATLPLNPSPGFTTSSARIRRTISSGYATNEYVLRLADAGISYAGTLIRYEAAPANPYSITNTSVDLVTDGILLEGGVDAVSYSYQIPSSSSNRWLAGLPVFRREKDGRARFYEYQLTSGVFTTTETTGFARYPEGSENPNIGVYLFQTVPNLSQRTVEIRNPEGFVISRETLYHTGSGFTRGQLEEFFYQNGRYHHTLVDGVETRRVEWPDSTTQVVKDEEGRVTTSKFDTAGELLWEEAGAGGGVGAVRTTYEKVGLTTTTLVNGAVTKVEVTDALGRLVSSKDQNGTITTFTYPNGGLDTESTLPGGIVKLEEHYLDGNLKARSGSGQVASFYSLDLDPWYLGYQKNSSVGSSTAHTTRKKTEYHDETGRLTRTLRPSPTGSNRFILQTYNYEQDTLLSVSSSEVERTLHDEDPEYVYTDESLVTALPTEYKFADSASLTDPVARLGGITTQGQDLDNNGLLSFGTTINADRFTKRETSYLLSGGVVYQKTRDYSYPDTTGATPLITETLDSVSFIKAGAKTYSRTRQITEPSTRTLTTTTLVTPETATVVTTEDDSATTASVDTRTTQVNSYIQTVEKAGGGANETYKYDSFGRVVGYKDPRNALTISYFNDRFLPSSVTNQLNEVTSYTYYLANEKNSGRLKTVTRPGGLVETTAYNDRGQPTLVNGSGTYPKLYGYDSYGDQVTLETYGTYTALTRWAYQTSTGLLLKKRYDDVNKTAGLHDFQYTYTPDGKLATRTTGKGVVTTYLYHTTTRDLTNINYTGDSNLTPDVTMSGYDGFGRPGQVSEARTGGTDTVGTDANTGTGNYTTSQAITYDPQTGAPSLAYDSSHRWLKNVKLGQTSHNLGRSTGFEVKVGTANTVVSSQAYSYDAATSRLQGVSSADLVSALSLLPGAETLQGVSVSRAGNVVHSRNLSVDLLGRTVGVNNKAGASLSALASIASVGHKYDSAGRRDDAQREDGTWWDYSYNDRSEITGAIKRTSANDLVPGLSFGYTYDDMGNRATSTSGTGTGASPRTYGRNRLNQYTSLTHDGRVNVLARADTSLTANTPTNATHNGIDTQGNLYGVRQTATTPTNGKLVTTPLKRSGTTGDLTVQNVLTWVPPATFVPTYDADGNLTYDGRWTYTWDGENRLVTATTSSNALTGGAPNITVKYAYDWMGRRIGASTTQSGTTTHQSYVCDGWNPVAEWIRTNLTVEPSASNLQRTHLWGPDIASAARATFGTRPGFQTAGGVGGLIASTWHNGSSKDHFIPSYDANGNIIAWSDGTGAVIQKQDYDPFGNSVLVENLTTAATVAKLPSFGFSTKPRDAATGMYYYGYRYYDPVTGRWPSKDPIEEAGGINLYAFGQNDAINGYDVLGMKICTKKRIDKKLFEKELKFLSNIKGKLKASIRGTFEVCDNGEKTLAGEITGGVGGEIPTSVPLLSVPWSVEANGKGSFKWCNGFLGGEVSVGASVSIGLQAGVSAASLTGDVQGSTSWQIDVDATIDELSLNAKGKDIVLAGRIVAKVNLTIPGWSGYSYTNEILKVSGPAGTAPDWSISWPTRAIGGD